jgi:hypothetical protein
MCNPSTLIATNQIIVIGRTLHTTPGAARLKEEKPIRMTTAIGDA